MKNIYSKIGRAYLLEDNYFNAIKACENSIKKEKEVLPVAHNIIALAFEHLGLQKKAMVDSSYKRNTFLISDCALKNFLG